MVTGSGGIAGPLGPRRDWNPVVLRELAHSRPLCAGLSRVTPGGGTGGCRVGKTGGGIVVTRVVVTGGGSGETTKGVLVVGIEGATP